MAKRGDKISASIPLGGLNTITIFGHRSDVYGIPAVEITGLSEGQHLKPEQAEAIAEGLKKAAEDSRK